jgi:hypothetical protein
MTDRDAIQAARDNVVIIAQRWQRDGFDSAVLQEATAMATLVDSCLLADCPLPGPAITIELRIQRERLGHEIQRAEQHGFHSSLIGACRELVAVLDNELRLCA